jgi:hypothetical protein
MFLCFNILIIFQVKINYYKIFSHKFKFNSRFKLLFNSRFKLLFNFRFDYFRYSFLNFQIFSQSTKINLALEYYNQIIVKSLMILI